MRAVAVAALVALVGCAWPPKAPGWPGWPDWLPWGRKGPQGDTRYGVEVVDYAGVADFHARALAFYERLSLRRVNSYGTYQDRVLREYFRDEAAFSDYYADLADDLDLAHFEQNRAFQVEVAEFVFDGPGRARVRVRLVGEDGKPLRPFSTDVEREDRWERQSGRWWVVPGNP